MTMQSDLFDPTEEIPACEQIDQSLSQKAPEPLAMPCGFMNAANARCERRAHRPVMMNGVQMVWRNRQMLHCEIDCFRAIAAAPAPQAEDLPG